MFNRQQNIVQPLADRGITNHTTTRNSTRQPNEGPGGRPIRAGGTGLRQVIRASVVAVVASASLAGCATTTAAIGAGSPGYHARDQGTMLVSPAASRPTVTGVHGPASVHVDTAAAIALRNRAAGASGATATAGAPATAATAVRAAPAATTATATATATTAAATHGKGVSPGGLYESTLNRMSANSALAVFQDMRSTGAQWVRLDYNYAGSVTAHGGASDQTIQQARNAGLNVSVILGDGTAAMPESAGYRASGNGWMTTSVKHLASLGIHDFEIGNEVNLGVNWGGTANPAAYAGLLKTVYPIIHAADPQAVVLTAGMAPYGKQSPTRSAQGVNYHPFDFIAQMYKNGAHGSFDAVNLHPYTYPVMPATADGGYNMLSVLPDLIAIMKANGDGSMPIWWTESGIPTGTDGGYHAYTVAQQQETIKELFQVAAKYPQVGPVFLYDWQDGGNDGDFGLYTASHAKKASYATFAGMTTLG